MIDAAALRARFSYDPLTGAHDFPRKIGGVPLKPERLAWLWVHGEWPRHELCFIDGDKSNLRIGNLVNRVRKGSPLPGPGGRVDYVRPQANRSSKTGVPGVKPTSSGRFRSMLSGRTFDTVAEARADYISRQQDRIEKRVLHGN